MTFNSSACSEKYSRELLEKWRGGAEWRSLASGWLQELVQRYGKEMFRTRKGDAKQDVKEVCEEVLPLAIWMTGYPDVLTWNAKFSPRGCRADAWLRPASSSQPIPLQIVGAFDGLELATQMRDLNDRGRTTTIVKSGKEIEEAHARLIKRSIERKTAKKYASDFWLLVAIDDCFVQLSDLPGAIAQAGDAAGRSGFAQVHLVGMVSRVARRVR